MCSLIYEYICNLFVQVATPGSIEFGGAIAEEESEKWMLVKDQEASFQCISRSDEAEDGVDDGEGHGIEVH